MAWARLDDKFHSHPTTWQVGLEANGLYCRGISYAADQLTDGFLPEAWVSANVPATARTKDPRGVVKALVDAGLWDRLDNGFRIVGYLDYNPSRAEVLAARADISEKRREAGRRGAASRWHGKSDGKTMANDMAGEAA